MRRVDVDRMMASMSALEYKEWEAYERATGPLDSTWEREMIAQLHELIQLNNQLTGAAITKKGKKNPAGKFRNVVRPDRLWSSDGYLDDEDPDDDDDLEDYYDDVEDEVEPVDDGSYDPAKDPFAYM